MNRRIYTCMTLAVGILMLITSCKKIEKQFPKGNYQMDINASYTYGGTDYDVVYTSDRIKLIDADDNYLSLKLYKFGVNPFDTVYFDTSTLTITDKQYVEGRLNAGLTWVPEHDYYDLSNGEIMKISKNKYEIHGDISFHGVHEVIVSGTYIFKQKE